MDPKTICKYHTFRIALIDDPFVGKTSIVKRMSQNVYSDEEDATIGADFNKYTLRVNQNTIVSYNIYHVAGQERYRPLIPLYTGGSDAVIFVYDITNKKSFDLIEKWVLENTFVEKDKEKIFALIGKSDIF